MYVPRAFAVDDVPILHQQMLATPLPVLVTHASQGLIASHVPLLLNPDEGPYGTLYGHLARANPHCKALAEGVENLVIFAGEQAYISPSFYPSKAEHGKAVPTWNYLAVHAYGTAEVFDDAERLLALVSRLSNKHEADRSDPWSVSDAPADYIDSMLKAIVGFRLPITRLDGKRKLSQNRDATDQAGVRKGLLANSNPQDHALAHLMAKE
ncbi:FMN-binding negative transcriptional regulator [Pseudomonas psychrophila]|uniref:FMN-binding negative transcriptional regulator n=1 Tax=Pseudomonas psychrophila TaxID=122355 RepID=A0A8I1FTI0_9PSED|nr:FMN-binding negative transcriptional regulator [Pseudomonas psychrophila]KAB0484143.1 FMN-binding negative transcriptional regulator [Pseudomonas psychrophila]KMM97094.1 FMN-binding negative transcriptional regulator [Pseudomonas psychrophila]KOX65189.1 transcriptional regulator [Pseudomonas psychrophila]MBJ2256706.1 FMN-binding negative transcriptional regulator [Pseudomonas psychrophila]QIE31207.1 FMN-binding negative transcriptional regulator [Pseudomonas psychrophila]